MRASIHPTLPYARRQYRPRILQHYHMDSTQPGSSHSQYSKNRRAPEQPCLQALLRFRMATESISLHHFILKPTEPTIGSYITMETRTTIPPLHPAELRHRPGLFIR